MVIYLHAPDLSSVLMAHLSSSGHPFSFSPFPYPLITACGFDLQRFSPLVTFPLSAKNTNHTVKESFRQRQTSKHLLSSISERTEQITWQSGTIFLTRCKALLIFK